MLELRLSIHRSGGSPGERLEGPSSHTCLPRACQGIRRGGGGPARETTLPLRSFPSASIRPHNSSPSASHAEADIVILISESDSEGDECQVPSRHPMGTRRTRNPPDRAAESALDFKISEVTKFPPPPVFPAQRIPRPSPPPCMGCWFFCCRCLIVAALYLLLLPPGLHYPSCCAYHLVLIFCVIRFFFPRVAWSFRQAGPCCFHLRIV